MTEVSQAAGQRALASHTVREKKSQETVLEECSTLNLCGWIEAGEMSGKKRLVDLGKRLAWHFLWDIL